MSGLTRGIIGAGSARLSVALATFIAVLFVLRLSLFPGASDDDGEILYYTQSWGLLYKGNQPPLYAWLILAAEAVAGPVMAAVLAVKFLLLGAFYAFAYLAGRRLFADGLFAALAPLALVACFFIGWDAVVNYSHTILLLAAMAAVLWLTLRLENRNGWTDYLWLALAIAAGMLAKYNFALFLLPLLAGAWRHGGLRPRVFCPTFWIALALAGLLAAAPLAAFLGDAGAVSGAVGAGRLFPPVDDRLAAAVRGLTQFTVSSLGMVSPLLPLAVFMFPRAMGPLPHPMPRLIQSGRFLEAYLVTLVLLAVAAILVTGASDVRNNWLVVWFPAAFYLLLRIKVFTDAASGDRGRALAGRLHWFAVCLLVIALAVPVGLIVRGAVGPETCRKCNFFIPYGDLARSLASAGFTTGTVVAEDRPNQLAGNLRRYFPKARTISTRWRDYRPPLPKSPPQSAPGKCLVIWLGDGGGGALALATKLRGAPIPDDVTRRRVTLPLPRNGDRRLTWSYLVMDGMGECR